MGTTHRVEGKIDGDFLNDICKVNGKSEMLKEYFGTKKINFKKLLIIPICVLILIMLFYPYCMLPEN